MKVLQIDRLNKRYKRIHAVRDLSLEIEAGSVYGILGPNGSGKTTTLGMILDVITPDSGRYEWFEGKYGRNARRHIGALLETPNFYPYLHAMDNLNIIAHIKRVSKNGLEDLLKQVNLWERRHSKFKTYSLGMKQRLAIAATLVGEPQVLIFDEPTNGLDPQGIAEIRELILQIAASGKTIFMASHILDEVEKVCSHVAIIKAGKLLASGPVGSIINNDITLELQSDNNDLLYQLLSRVPTTRMIERRGRILVAQVAAEVTGGDINRLAFDHGILLSHLVARKKKLEEEFLEITTKA
ncbi:MAG TPA: ATP-binding cassette domain-containing protein [Phaeodactylibacter sp.]|nr:ATP-binding cassette domain-containing protein [Phaeodactylibacter sp.]